MERELGLVDSVDEEDFGCKLASLEDRLERKCRRVVPREIVQPEFYAWFISEKHDVHVVCSSMLRSVRVAAQLGRPTRQVLYQCQ